MKYWLELNPITSSLESSTSNFSQLNLTENLKSGQKPLNVLIEPSWLLAVSCVQCTVQVSSQVTRRPERHNYWTADRRHDWYYRLQSIIFWLTLALSVCHNSNIALNDSIAPVSNFFKSVSKIRMMKPELELELELMTKFIWKSRSESEKLDCTTPRADDLWHWNAKYLKIDLLGRDAGL